jgi:hypothetical protein
MLRGGVQVFEQAPRPQEPTVRNRRLATDREVVERQPWRDPRGAAQVAALVIELVGMLAGIKGGGEILKPPGCHRQPLQGLRLLLGALRQGKILARLFPSAL